MSRFSRVGAIFEGVYGIQMVPKSLMGVGGLIWVVNEVLGIRFR